MGGEVCKRKGYERGPWYEIKNVADVIRLDNPLHSPGPAI